MCVHLYDAKMYDWEHVGSVLRSCWIILENAGALGALGKYLGGRGAERSSNEPRGEPTMNIPAVKRFKDSQRLFLLNGLQLFAPTYPHPPSLCYIFCRKAWGGMATLNSPPLCTGVMGPSLGGLIRRT